MVLSLLIKDGAHQSISEKKSHSVEEALSTDINAGICISGQRY